MAGTANKPEWEDVPFVTVFKPCCPHCRSEDYHRLKTLDNGDDSATKRVECRRCSRRYRIVSEPLPVSGEFITWPDTIADSEGEA